jgi:antitoxin component HigA of HigAB toxin-antitoxin module
MSSRLHGVDGYAQEVWRHRREGGLAMDIRPIRSDKDHAAALGEIDHLWGADPDTAEGARLEILLTLVGAYEDAHHPIPPS